MTADEFVPTGLHVDESKEFAGMLADASVDLIDVSSGFYESSFKIMQGSESPDGGFVDLALQVKAVVAGRSLVSVTQRLSAVGRGSPHHPARLRAGRGGMIADRRGVEVVRCAV
jgi:hypothetical protein